MHSRRQSLRNSASALLCFLIVTSTAPGQDSESAARHFIPTKTYSDDENQELLDLFAPLRVADVSDGMDRAGLQDIGLVDPSIIPLWKDTIDFSHRFVGIAVTARYVPTQDPPAGKVASEEAFDRWVGEWYGNKSGEPFVDELFPGAALIIEETGHDTGSIGSNNILLWKQKGCVGVVSSTTARDTDEIIAQKIPLYFKHPGRGIRPGRNEIESVNAPVVVGGVLVKPGDIIVADGDGVIVVPRAHAREVASYARKTIDEDKAARAKKYEELGLETDKSVE
ncbi:MAG TPA: RraA family protein [Verrucomicrobiales bacterium]|nr:RraA family protein [Verrucomicrobiales bacterium]